MRIRIEYGIRQQVGQFVVHRDEELAGLNRRRDEGGGTKPAALRDHRDRIAWANAKFCRVVWVDFHVDLARYNLPTPPIFPSAFEYATGLPSRVP